MQKINIFDYFSIALTLVLLVSLAACGGSNESDEATTPLESDTNTVVLDAPEQLIVYTSSSSSIELIWKSVDGVEIKYKVYRNGDEIGTSETPNFTDKDLSAATRYTYSVLAFNRSSNQSPLSNEDWARTLDAGENQDWYNGTATDVSTFIGTTVLTDDFEACDNEHSVFAITDLNSCLRAVAEEKHIVDRLKSLRAFAARLRREQNPELIELGMRLFHSKSLSKNEDVSCSSCHHPAVGCGGDNLSLPIGVNAEQEELIGVGRTDGNDLPLVPRNSQPTCNAGLWSNGLFWDNRVDFKTRISELFDSGSEALYLSNEVRTDDDDVSNSVNELARQTNNVSLSLLMSQAHFPTTAEPEMGESSDFESDTAYREYIAQRLSGDWNEWWISAFGDAEKNYLRLSQAMAAYQASQIFIENDFFDFLDGNDNALTDDEKRGGILFYANMGCVQCHDGPFFTNEVQREIWYPQIGIGTNEDGSDSDKFRVPTLLNVGLTGPWGHNGQFSTLRRNVAHYFDIEKSLQDYFGVNENGENVDNVTPELCNLEQFVHLGEGCREVLAPNGFELTVANIEEDAVIKVREDDGRVDAIVSFLNTLTDESAISGSNEINVLIPPRDGGPDGKQLDAVDEDGNFL